MNKSKETVKVAVRCRPMNAIERNNHSVQCVTVDRQNNQVVIKNPETDKRTFGFDSVYGDDSTQREIYDEIAFPLVESVLEGYNGTIFAYGQTGCGKTHTMMGDIKKEAEMGIIPNAFNHIFGFVGSGAVDKKFLVRCSFMEIYNEEIRDLLGKDAKRKLDLREDPKTGVFVKDLTKIEVKNTAELNSALSIGNKNRQTDATAMNATSSRSHCIFTVYVEIMENANDPKNKKIKAGKLNLVDLAVKS